MRIALAIDFFYPELGGMQDSVALLAEELGKRGHIVDIYVPRASHRDYKVANLPERELDLGKNVSIKRIFSIPIPSPTNQSRLIIPTFIRWLGMHKPDVIHTNSFYGIGMEMLSASHMLKVPLIGTNHFAVTEYAMYFPSIKPERFKRWSLRGVVWYFNHCDFVSAPSQSNLDEMKANGLKSASKVISNPIDTHIFHTPAEGERQTLKKKFGFSDVTMIYAGKFAPEKYVDDLIRTLPHIISVIPDAMLVLAGHGSERQKLEELSRSLGVFEHVKFTGTLTKRELADAFRAADMFVSASTSETQSMVLFQAMSCGLCAG